MVRSITLLPNRHKHSDTRNQLESFFVLVGIALWGGYDSLSTFIALEYGAIETNPFVRFLLTEYGWATTLSVKFAAVGCITLIWWSLRTKSVRQPIPATTHFPRLRQLKQHMDYHASFVACSLFAAIGFIVSLSNTVVLFTMIDSLSSLGL